MDKRKQDLIEYLDNAAREIPDLAAPKIAFGMRLTICTRLHFVTGIPREDVLAIFDEWREGKKRLQAAA
jgi:hypothetical protein